MERQSGPGVQSSGPSPALHSNCLCGSGEIARPCWALSFLSGKMEGLDSRNPTIFERKTLRLPSLSFCIPGRAPGRRKEMEDKEGAGVGPLMSPLVSASSTSFSVAPLQPPGSWLVPPTC